MIGSVHAAPSGWAQGWAGHGWASAGPHAGPSSLVGPHAGPTALVGPASGPIHVSGAVAGPAMITGAVAGPATVIESSDGSGLIGHGGWAHDGWAHAGWAHTGTHWAGHGGWGPHSTVLVAGPDGSSISAHAGHGIIVAGPHAHSGHWARW